MPTTKPSDEDDRTTALGLARYAYEYLEAALLVDEKLGADEAHAIVSPTPAYFLAAHAIELTLKAYLRFSGVPVRQLRSRTYGHDIHACYRKAKEIGLLRIFGEQREDIEALSLLADLNKDQGLRYIRTGAKTFPSWGIVEPFAVRLHQAVAPLVGYKTFSKAFHQTSARTGTTENS